MIWALIPTGLQRYAAKAAIICAILFAAVSWRAYDVHKQRRVGWDRHAAKVETATNEAVSKAGSAGRKSADPAAGGVLNPRYRD